MAKRMSDVKELFESTNPFFKATLLPVQEDLKKAARVKRAELGRLKERGKLTRERVQEAVYELAEQYHFGQARVRDEIAQEFAKLEKQWRAGREPIKELLALQRAQVKYSALNRDGVDAEIERYHSDPAAFEPDEAACLEAAAVRTQATGLGGLRAMMKRSHADQPWLRSRPDLLELQNLHSAEFGQSRVMTPLGVDDYDISGLLDATGDADGE